MLGQSYDSARAGECVVALLLSCRGEDRSCDAGLQIGRTAMAVPRPCCFSAITADFHVSNRLVFMYDDRKMYTRYTKSSLLCYTYYGT